MLDYYKDNSQLFLLLTIWLIVGIVAGPITYALIPMTMFLMKRQGMFEELFIGYLFILILSDSLENHLIFAKGVKNVYISTLAIFMFFDLKSFYPFNNLYKIYIPFFLFAIITMLTSISDPFIAVCIQKTISFIISFMIIPNFVTKLYREKGEQFFKRLVYFLFTTLITGFILKVIAPGVASIGTGRYRGVLGNPNGLGLYAFFTFIVLFVIIDYFPKIFNKYEISIFYLTIFLSILLTGSRNAIISILIFYMFQRFFKISPFFGFIMSIVIVVIAEIISSNLSSILTRFGLGQYFRVKTLDDGSGRYIAWAFAWKHIQQNYFVGKGFSYDEYYMRQHYGELEKLGHQGGIHNSYLTFWMDQGLIGLLLYFRSFFIMFLRAAHNTKFAFPIMFSIAFTAFFESWLVGSLSAYAFLALLIFTLISSDEINPNISGTNILQMEPLALSE